MANVELIDSTSALITSTTLSVAKPTLEDGCSVWIASVGRGTAGIVVEPPGDPAGFTYAGMASSGGTSSSHILFYLWKKNVVTAAEEPTNYTATYDTTVHGNAFCWSLRNAETGVTPTVNTLTETDGTNVFSCPAIVVDTAGTAVFHLPAQTSSTGITGFTGADGTFTEIEDPGSLTGTNHQAGALYYKVTDTTAAATEYTSTGGTGISLGITFAIEPAGGGGDPDPPPGSGFGTSLGDLFEPWRKAYELTAWEDYVNYVQGQTGISNFADAQRAYWKAAAGAS